jgi:hypothetical protein
VCLERGFFLVTCLASFRTSSPSTCSEAFGVRASRTKWLSQCGQYSSLPLNQPSAGESGCRHGYAPVLELASILAEGLLALFADEDHFEALKERVISRLLVAFCAVEPLFAYML